MKKCHVKMMKKVIDVILDWYQTQNNNLYWPSMLFFGEQPLWFWVHIIEGHYLFGFGYEIKEKYSFRGCPFHLSQKMLLYPTGVPEAENPFTFFAAIAKSKWQIKFFDQNIQFMSSHRSLSKVWTIYFQINN